MLNQVTDITENDIKKRDALIASLCSMDFEMAKLAFTYKIESKPEMSFQEYCESKSVNYDYQSSLALNGVLSKVFMPCKRGSISDYRGIKPGERATALLNALSAEYKAKVDSGEIPTKKFSVPVDCNTEQGNASLRIAIRVSIRNEKRLAKREGRAPNVHSDHLGSVPVN